MTRAVLKSTAVTHLDTASRAPAKTVPANESVHKTPLNAPFRLATKQPKADADPGNVSRDACLSAPHCQPLAARQMCVSGLNHFNISASQELIEQVKQFYMDIVGLTLGPRAHLDHEGYWLYAGCTPIVHLSVRTGVASNDQKGYFNHISLGCVGLKGAIAKLIDTHTPYRVIQLPDVQQTQLFLVDPAGIGVELTFFNETM